MLLGAMPFSGRSHTGVVIEAEVLNVLERAGLGKDFETGVTMVEKENLFTEVHRSCTDDGSNMVKGLDQCEGDGCTCHKLGRAVLTGFLQQKQLHLLRKKQRAAVASMHRSEKVMTQLHVNQKSCRLDSLQAPPKCVFTGEFL